MPPETPANRALLLTPPGGAAIAVVRLAGPGVGAFLAAHFSRPAAEGRCVHGDLTDGSRVIDDPVVVLHPGGTTADVNLHGGPWVIQATLDLARRAGFEVVESPGLPLPDEAVADLADDVIGREIAAHLPLARTELAIRVLLVQAELWAGANCGAGFPACMKDSCVQAGKPALQLEDRSLWWLLNPPRVAIVGAANVGKSTLANRLFAQERSITADVPGTTRDWVGEMADLNGLAVMLVDTPGLRPTPDPIERAAIDCSREQIDRADLVVLVLDATRPLDPEQRPLLAAYPQAVWVVNKSDRPAAFEPGDAGVIRTVATTGEGLDDLRRAIAGHFGCDAMDLDRPRWWTRRQLRLLEVDGPVRPICGTGTT